MRGFNWCGRQLSLAAILALGTTTSTAAAGESWAIVDVSVVAMGEDSVVPRQTVLVRDGHIVAVDAVGAVAVGNARLIDGRGRFLMPGLAEMHAHIPPTPDSAADTLDTLALYVANGITLARGMLGAAHHLELRDRAARGEILAPRIYTSGPSLNGQSVTSPDEGRAMVAEQHEVGYDFLKIHPGLDTASFVAIAVAAREAGMPFAGHVSEEVGLAAALTAGQASIDHLDQYLPALLRDDAPSRGVPSQFFGWNLAAEVDPGKIAPLADATSVAGVWNVPTQSLIEQLLLAERTTEQLLARPEMRYVSAATAENWTNAKARIMADPAYSPELARQFVEVRRRLIKALHDADAGLLLGSDAPQIFNVPGFSIHEELRLLVESGLTPHDALATGTVNVARFLGEEREFGRVAEGHRADLLLLAANPLDDVANVRQRVGVMLGGRWFPEDVLQARIEEIAVRHGR
jgi:imidazolonepropionase-like amidohydrolase